MSELKVINLGDIRYAIENDESVYYEYYAKPEADKVIAELEADKLELKQRVNVLEGRLFGLSQSHNIAIYTKGCLERRVLELKKEKEYSLECTTKVINAQERELRHQKYKRCLAMHDYCLCELEFAFRDTCVERSVKGCVRWRKWANRWLELAKKLKEAK